jgi:hypothetical protein
LQLAEVADVAEMLADGFRAVAWGVVAENAAED